MKITEIRVFPQESKEKKLHAFVNITFDNCFMVRGLRVIEGSHGLFVVMPCRKVKGNAFRDVANPTTAEFKAYIQKEVLNAYALFIEDPPLVQALNDDDPYER